MGLDHRRGIEGGAGSQEGDRGYSWITGGGIEGGAGSQEGDRGYSWITGGG